MNNHCICSDDRAKGTFKDGHFSNCPKQKENKINEFLTKLKNNHTDGEFGLICLKCGSTNVTESYDGDGGPVCKGAYTADFDGEHFIKCLDCGNAKVKTFNIDMNGAFQ